MNEIREENKTGSIGFSIGDVDWCRVLVIIMNSW